MTYFNQHNQNGTWSHLQYSPAEPSIETRWTKLAGTTGNHSFPSLHQPFLKAISYNVEAPACRQRLLQFSAFFKSDLKSLALNNADCIMKLLRAAASSPWLPSILWSRLAMYTTNPGTWLVLFFASPFTIKIMQACALTSFLSPLSYTVCSCKFQR